MKNLNDPLSWVKLAEEDYTMSASAIRLKKPFVSSACFHAQQWAEKYMKAILVSKGEAFPKTHDLLLLDTLCQKAGITMGVYAKDLSALSDYAVRVRYPGDEPTQEEAREAIVTSKAVRRFARKFLGIK